MKVFQITENEHWFGETLEDVFAVALKETGVTREEYEDCFDPYELTNADLDVPGKVQLSTEGEPVKMGSYREALEIVTADGTRAGFLCGK